MEIRQLEYFCSVAKYMNFTRAAEEMHISQPAMTASIKALEEELHVNLFIRERKRIRLTSEGNTFLETILPILCQLKQAASDMQQLSDNGQSILSIGAAPVTGAYLLHTLYSSFLGEHPEIRTNVYEMGSYGLLEAIDSNQIEMAYMVILDDVKDKYDYLPIETGGIQVVVSRQHPLAKESRVTIEQLKNEQVILLPNHSFIGRKIIETYAEAGFVPHVLCEPQQMFTVFNLVADGSGISFVLGDQFLKYSYQERIVSLPLEPAIPYACGFVWKKGKKLSQASQICTEYFLADASIQL